MDTVYLDLETTGLGSNDAILEIGILDDQGEVLVDQLIRPLRHTSWPDAQMVNGIAPADVGQSPPLDAIRPKIIEVVRGRRVVIYNAAFDTQFLSDELQHAASVECCMWAFAEHYGEWRPVPALVAGTAGQAPYLLHIRLHFRADGGRAEVGAGGGYRSVPAGVTEREGAKLH
jgi:hypothetical protein